MSSVTARKAIAATAVVATTLSWLASCADTDGLANGDATPDASTTDSTVQADVGADQTTPPIVDGANIDVIEAPADAGADVGSDAPVDSAGPDAADSGPMGCEGALNCERIVFTTSTTYAGTTLGNIAAADAKCQARANVSTLPRVKGRTFLAFVSYSITSVAARFPHGTGEYRRAGDNALVAANWNSLFDGSLDSPLVRDEFGAVVTDPYAWTGSDPDGTVSGSLHCENWTGGTAGQRGTIGATNGDWAGNGAVGCTATLHLYCFEF